MVCSVSQALGEVGGHPTHSLPPPSLCVSGNIHPWRGCKKEESIFAFTQGWSRPFTSRQGPSLPTSHPAQSSGPENHLANPLCPLPLPHLCLLHSFHLEHPLPSCHLPNPHQPFQTQARLSLSIPGAGNPGWGEVPGAARKSP